MAVLIAVTSDLHAGSTVALCPPRIELDDGGAYEASTAQRWLWSGWLDYWDWIARLRDDNQAELWCEFNGDLVDGNHHGTTQILTGNPTAQGLVFDRCIHEPMALDPSRIFFVRGTEAHVGVSGSAEERIALGLRRDGRPVEGDPATGRASWWHLRMEHDGVRLDFAHHGRMGQRPWTKATGVGTLAAQIFFEHCDNDEPYPHLAIRSHYHRTADSGDLYRTRVIQTPAWQLATSYVHKIAAESLADVGGIAILIRDGEYSVHKFLRRPDRGAIWRAS
jgi:hypothetical protein